jgi:hypothetical protein
MNQLTEILIERLEMKGIRPHMVPGISRDLVNTLSANPHATIQELNSSLHLLGWNDFELDDHTLQLLIASFEAEEVTRQSALRAQGSEPVH